jgi:hypothetical protein
VTGLVGKSLKAEHEINVVERSKVEVTYLTQVVRGSGASRNGREEHDNTVVVRRAGIA